MAISRKLAFGSSKSQMSKKKERRLKANRQRLFETLERRELMTSDFSPAVRAQLATMHFRDASGYEQAGQMIAAKLGGTSSSSSGAGENSSTFNTSEVETNGTRATANFLPLGTADGKNYAVNVTGSMQNGFDEDYYYFDLRKGDIFDVRINIPSGQQPSLTLMNASGLELMFSRQVFNPPLTGRPASQSPRFTSGAATMTYVIDADARYYFRVGDATGSYTLNFRTYRPTIEQQPIGTKQSLFLDFDGAFLRNDVLGLNLFATGNNIPPAQTVRVPTFYSFLPTLGIPQSDGDAIIRDISRRVELKLKTQLAADTANGLYSASGVPGEFDIQILNSVDNNDVWGQANVSRVLVGGTQTQMGIPVATGLLGIAQSIDIGNFDREETALVMLDIMGADALDTVNVPRSGSASVATIFAEFVAETIAHEAGHFFGATHTDPTSRLVTIMDNFYDPLAAAGRDGIIGNADDEPLRFLNDDYDTGILTTGGGVNNVGQTIAFALATGKVGTLVSGVSYNDRNRNGRQDTGEEGLAGWEVFADRNGNGVRDLGEPKTLTSSTGRYDLPLAAGNYNLQVVRPAGWVASVSTENVKPITVASAPLTVNFGSFLPSTAATGFVFNDSNGNGVRDTGESPMPGIYVYLDLDGDNRPDIGEPASITTDKGAYNLVPPGPGTYTIREVIESGIVQTYPGEVRGFEHTVVYTGSNALVGYDFANLESLDYGDAPAAYAVTKAQNGASHGITSGLRLGTQIDSDGDGQPSTNANGDDVNGLVDSSGAIVDDEDGVSIITPLVTGDSNNVLQITVTNTTSTPAYLQGWIDLNSNGSWTDAGEQIATNVLFPAGFSGTQNITFTIPSNTAFIGNKAARFRLSQDQNLAPTGKSKTGEVEDYILTVVAGPRRLLQPDSFTVARNSTNNALDVLANDFAVPGSPWTITSVTAGSNGGRVQLANAGKSLLYSPALNFVGRETFTYTASNGSSIETTTVTMTVSLQFNNPVAVDDSFDVVTNANGFPLNVLANDVEGRGGALIVSSVSTPDQGGSAAIGSGGQSIRYTPRRGFGGTETFTYTATDGTGATSSANITVHVIPGDRTDDEVEFSFQFLNTANEPITQVRQGDVFKVVVSVDDLRPEKAALETPPRTINDPGVYSAYLDLLYSTGLVIPNAPTGGNLDFAATFVTPYRTGIEGSAQTPGIINELGAFIGAVSAFSEPDPLQVVILEFTATSAGIAEFVGDPADNLPNSEVTFYNTPTTRVPTAQIRYGRASIEIVPNGVNFPIAVDDARFNVTSATPFNVDVLTNDQPGTQPPIRIASVTQPANGQTTINRNNTPDNFADDTITYQSNANFTGVDQFRYTITDERGFVSTATVTVHVGAATSDDFIRLRLDVTDLAGAPITQVQVGQQFQLRGFVEDLRTGAARPGVFAAYQDVLYNSQLVSVNSQTADPFFQVAFGPEYLNGKSGDIRVAGLINELGSVQTDTANPTGLGEKLQFAVTLTARNVGNATFIGDPADIKPFHDSLVFDPTVALTLDQIRFTSDSVQIVAASGGGTSSGGEGFTNRLNQYDVNNDGYVSPIDVLILVNSLNSGGGGLLTATDPSLSGEGGTTKYYVDVNGDNYLSPLDALGVINFINNRSVASGEGEAAPLPDPIVGHSEETGNSQVAMILNDLLDDDDDMEYLDGIASDIARKI